MTPRDAADRVTTPDFDGDTYDHDRDHGRLARQLGRVRRYLMDGEWHTLRDISHATGDPEASVSARIRDLRKDKFGGYRIERRVQGSGGHLYRLVTPSDTWAWN